jgi:hypothetical protein
MLWFARLKIRAPSRAARTVGMGNDLAKADAVNTALAN